MKTGSGRRNALITISLLSVAAVSGMSLAVYGIYSLLSGTEVQKLLPLLVTVIATITGLIATLPIWRHREVDQTLEDLTERVSARSEVEELLKGLNRLQKAGFSLLAAKSLDTKRSIFELRAGLNSLGVWDADDVADFNSAMRVRNAVVHDDLDQVNPKSIEEAIRSIDRLTKGIETFANK